MSYILATIPEDGMIRCEVDETFDPLYPPNRGKKIVHRESVALDRVDGIRVFDRLEVAKTEWSGPDSDEAILALNEIGQAEAIWLAESQMEKLVARISKWKGCYGLWPVKKLNVQL